MKSMIKQKLNDHWIFKKGSNNPLMEGMHGDQMEEVYVQLPHDAMIHEKRTKDAVAGSQSGFYPGGVYTYIKELDVPKEWKGQIIQLAFEGVYPNAKVYINDAYAGGCINGYRDFYISAHEFLRYGEKNIIKVDVNNTALPNSRWYSGSGIYREVHVLRGNLLHLPVNGIKITTPHITKDAAMVYVDITLENMYHLPKMVQVVSELYDASNHIVAKESTPVTVFPKSCMQRHRLLVEHPALWDCEHPNLYECRVKIMDGEEMIDEESIMFGIRHIAVDAKRGFQLNNTSIKLRGSCIHHDNGILGAATFPFAEERRCRQLKEAGFNCIRSSHQPLSKAMLNACDRLGMLVIDEVSDVWNNSKNHNDYSMFFQEHWEEDVTAMVEKDFNHPCVIMYCMGNEIQEAGNPSGAALNRKMNQKIKMLDDTRFTTNAINGLTAASKQIPLMLADMQKQKQAQTKKVSSQTQTAAQGGSNQVNNMMSILIGPMADMVATHPLMSETIDEFVSGMDVAGYNYMTARHALEHSLYPNRIVLGTETFPSEIARLWEIVKQNHHVIGDMTWTGYDYLGEAGIGNFYYDDGRPFSNHWPDSVAYCGDIDIIGNRRVISYYREIIFGLRKKPYIAVNRMQQEGKECLQTPWAFKDQIHSWTWTGYEGKDAHIDVYSDADEVELLVNGKSLGKKPAGATVQYTASFITPYEAGSIKAINYRNGQAVETQVLHSAIEEVHMQVQVENSTLCANGEDLAYVTVQLVDAQGVLNMQKEKEISVTIHGPVVIQACGSANPQTEQHYDERTWKTWDGSMLVVVRATNEAGDAQLTLQCGDKEETVLLQVR